jgi:hypothetical protein
VRFACLTRTDQEKWSELSRSSLQLLLQEHPGFGLFMALPLAPNDFWNFSLYGWAKHSHQPTPCLFPNEHMKSPIRLFALMLAQAPDFTKSVSLPTVSHFIPPGPVKHEEVRFIQETFHGTVLCLAKVIAQGNGVLACWARSAQFKPLPGGVPATTLEMALPYWPWDRSDLHDHTKNGEVQHG